MNNAPAVNCPVHGTHGCLSNGKCWYCVQSGTQVSVAPKIRQIGTAGKIRRIG